MAGRKRTPTPTETLVLTKSARRCPLCFHLFGDLEVKHGQIAHLDQDPSNFNEDNLCFMCLDHHSDYDSTTSQHKNFTKAEVRELRQRLYKAIIEKHHHAVVIAPNRSSTEVVDEAARLIQLSNSKDITISTLLREAKMIAKKRGETEFVEWINNELKGYEGISPLDLPKYRQTFCEPYAFNPFHGWQPVMFASNEARVAYTYAPISQSVGSIEETLKNTGDNYLLFSSSAAIQQVEQNLDIPAKVQLRSSPTVLHNILESVRNAIHEWACSLT